MTNSGATLGILVTAPPRSPEFKAFLARAEIAHRQGQKVYSYLIFDAVEGLEEPGLQALKNEGMILHACALAAAERNIPNSEKAIFSGLVSLGELILRCDAFVTFSPGSLP